MTQDSQGTGFGQTEGDTALATQTDRKLKKPHQYQVLLHNDDYTTMEFVVMVLMNVFGHNEEQAMQIMLHVHQQGHGVAGVYSREVAEMKIKQVGDLATEHEYPLRCTVEVA